LNCAIESSVLARVGVRHGFGVRGMEAPSGTLCPEQVHGIAVALVDAAGGLTPSRADAVVCAQPDQPIAIVTADCVPILAAAADGSAVAAIHAGWRGLAAGVVAAGIEALGAAASPGSRLIVAIGPHIGRCCYEVDEPVLGALSTRFGEVKVQQNQRATRSGHARVSLGALVAEELAGAGIASTDIEPVEDTCTFCHPDRFESYRRDGSAAGRLVHFIAAR